MARGIARGMNRDQIVEDWDNQKDEDWYAVDEYRNGRIIRITVGDWEHCAEIARERVTGFDLVSPAGDELADPGEYGDYPFFRMTMIQAAEALDFLNGGSNELSDWITQAAAADMLGVSRARVNQLVNSGLLETDGAERSPMVTRESVRARIESEPKPGKRS